MDATQVRTRCRVHGPAGALAAFKAALVRPVPEEDRMPQPAGSLPVPDPELQFDFNGVLPMPDVLAGAVIGADEVLALYALGREEVEGRPDEPVEPLGYEWVQARGIATRADLLAYLERETPEGVARARRVILAFEQTGHATPQAWTLARWGTRWNAYDLEILSEHGEAIDLRFCTAATFPLPVFRALAAAYPTLAFRCACLDERGSVAGRGSFNPRQGDEAFAWCRYDDALLEEVLAGPLPPHPEILTTRPRPIPERPKGTFPPAPYGAPWTVMGVPDGEGDVPQALLPPEPSAGCPSVAGVRYGWHYVIVAEHGQEDSAIPWTVATGIQHRAVADLVAAAPEMLAVLRQISHVVGQLYPIRPGSALFNALDQGDLLAKLTRALGDVDRAVLGAEGRR